MHNVLGAIIDCADKNGSTPLHIAAQYGYDLLANTLLSYGANPSKKGYLFLCIFYNSFNLD